MHLSARSRPVLALLAAAAAWGGALATAAAGNSWYVDSPVILLASAAIGFVVGAWLPPRVAAPVVGAGAVALTVANQLISSDYAVLDDLTFFGVVVAGPALVGSGVAARAAQVAELRRVQEALSAHRRTEATAARLEEQNRLEQEVQERLGESIGAIALRAQGAQAAASDEARTTALVDMEAAARDALGHLRETLGWLRTPTDPGPEVVEPSPEVEAVRTSWSDLALAAGCGAALAVETVAGHAARGPAWANVVTALLVAAPLALRRRTPLLAAAATWGSAAAATHWLTPLPATVTAVLLLAVSGYAVGAWAPGRRWLVGALILGIALVSGVAAAPAAERDTDGILPTLVWTAVAVAAGRLAAGWRDRVARTQAAVRVLEEGRGAAVRMAVAEERAALARTLHDSVAHAMTVVCVQAAAARQVTDPGGVDDALANIAQVAQQELVALRNGLEDLEGDAPVVGPATVRALAEATGVEVQLGSETEWQVSGPAAGVMFRVLREGLTNVARHAPGAVASVRVHRVGDRWQLELTDTGTTQEPTLTGTGTGTGLSGLRETVEAAAGRLSWGRLPDRGFRLVADLPADRAAVVPA